MSSLGPFFIWIYLWFPSSFAKTGPPITDWSGNPWISKVSVSFSHGPRKPSLQTRLHLAVEHCLDACLHFYLVLAKSGWRTLGHMASLLPYLAIHSTQIQWERKKGFHVQVHVVKLFDYLKQALLYQGQNLSLHLINNHSSSTSYSTLLLCLSPCGC